MTKATSPSGSLDEAIAFRQGVSVVTIKDQLTGMLPKFSAGTRSRIVIDGNAPDSDVYYDDSMVGMGPGTIVPTPSQIFPLRLFDYDFVEFKELSEVENIGIANLEVTGSYTGELDATFRIQIANQDDDDVFTISSPIYTPNNQSEPGLNDLNVVVQNITEINDAEEEIVLVASGSYDSSQGISVYKVEIASAEIDAVDTIRWYKNGKLLTPSGGEEVITANDGNVLVDGENRIVVKFDYDGYEDIRFGMEAKHTVGDSWTIVAGAQQFRWSKGDFSSEDEATLVPLEGTEQASAGPIGILQSGFQLLTEGIYLKFPSQTGYDDGSDPNIEAPIWEFKVTSLKPEAAITAMQESSGKIQIYPDHRVEQRDFGQPKFHNDFDVATIDQHQVSTVEVLRLNEIGQQNPAWVDPASSDPVPRTSQGNTLLYNSEARRKKNLSYDEANSFDASLTPIIFERIELGEPGAEVLIDPLQRGWTVSNMSSDGSVGPYFTIRDLRGKQKDSKNNHFWFNFGNTSTNNTLLYDDKDPRPQLSDGIPIDISGRDLSEITIPDQRSIAHKGVYEVYNVPALSEIPTDSLVDGSSYWSNDLGVTMVSIENVHPYGDPENPGLISWPTSINSLGNSLYYLAASTSQDISYKTASVLGWDPDIDETTVSPKMSLDMFGNVLLNSTGTPTPLQEEDWMNYHGYEIAQFTETEWLYREGYVAYQDELHNKYFVLYDQEYQGYYIQFNVTDNLAGTPVTDVEADGTLAADNIEWMIDTNDDGAPDKRKSKSSLKLARVNLSRSDSAYEVSKKIIDRLNKELPASFLDPAHPFYTGQKVDEIFLASEDESDNHVTRIEMKTRGKIQDSNYDSLLPSTFQVYVRERGSLGLSQNVMSDTELSSTVAGNCICLYNATEYEYTDTSIPATVTVSAYSPHVIWFDLNGTSLSPEEALSLWSYSSDERFNADILDAFSNNRAIKVSINPNTPGRTTTYLIDKEIKNSEIFNVPFVSTLSSGTNKIRILQRDPGAVLTAPTNIPDQTAHDVNSGATVEALRLGTSLELRDREYISDSILFAIDDSGEINKRFSAEKRVVENYAHFQVNCVAEEKSGLLFDYTNQEWVDPDPDVGPALAKILKGGTSELSNYEPNITELFDNIPQKLDSTHLVWKRLEDSKEEIIASSVGFDITTSMYDSRNLKIWTKVDGTFHTASSLGLEDDQLGVDPYLDYTWDPAVGLSEIDWMTFEGYLPVPAFTHKIAQASYFLLPHPEKNFYIWFDVGQLSADPGDDGLLDNVMHYNISNDVDLSYIGGGVRVAIDSYDSAGVVAQKLVDRINSDRYDTKKVFVQINVNDDGEPEYQAIASGNINQYFEASINNDDSSIVDIRCKIPGLINASVFNQNSLVNFPVTESGDIFSISLLDDGDTDYYVDIKNKIAGFVIPPTTDVQLPDADTGLQVTVTEVPYSPAQPGLRKVLSKFLPYEDMNSMSRGYRKTLDTGVEVAVAGPVAYIQDDIGMLSYPVIMSNVSMKDPDQYDGVIEPLEIRSRASRNSPDAYFVAHEVKGQLQSDVAADSRQRSNPITQFINHAITRFDPYEDGIEHMEASPSIDGFVRNPIFNGTGLNDINIIGEYLELPGSPASTYYIECVTSYLEGSINDKFKWRKNDEDWSDTISLQNTNIGSSVVLTFDEIITGSSTEIKTVNVPPGSYAYEIKIYGRGDINGANEYYRVQYLDETLDSPTWETFAYANDAGVVQPAVIQDQSHPLYTPTPMPGIGYRPGRLGYSSVPNWEYNFSEGDTLIPMIELSSLKVRVLTSAEVNNLAGVENEVKVVIEFSRSAGTLQLDNGLTALFDYKNNHTSGDEWVFEAIAKSNNDIVGYLPFPGYLTWQESKIDPFVESSDPEESVENLSVPLPSSSAASATMAFNYDGFSAIVEDSTWEIEYVKSLNGQAFTLLDSSQRKERFEFDNDGILENDGDSLITLLRGENFYIRFPDSEQVVQKRTSQGHKQWTNGSTTLTAYGPIMPAGYIAYTDSIFSGITEDEWAFNYGLSPVTTSADDICPGLNDVTKYHNCYFLITDEVNHEKANINTTTVGGRYTVSYNVEDHEMEYVVPSFNPWVPGDTDGIQGATTLYWNGNPGVEEYQTALQLNSGMPPTPDEISWAVVNGYYSSKVEKKPTWSNDNGQTIICAVPLGTGWSPHIDTQTMSTRGSMTDINPDKILWSNDGGATIVIADGVTFDDTVAEDDPDHPIYSGYSIVELNEQQWHEYMGYEDYGHLVPQNIEVKIKSTDSILSMVKKTVRTINSFKNQNQKRVFTAKYIHPPEYIDFYDLNPDDEEEADEIAAVGGTWRDADYDNNLHVKLDTDWFNQYDYDPNSPPNRLAIKNRWKRGFLSIKVSSRNLGYHNITTRLADTPKMHEPLYENISAHGDPGGIINFEIENDASTDWGGYHTFKDVLEITSKKINNSQLKINSEVLYGNELSQLVESGIPKYFDNTSTIETGIKLSDVDTGIPYNVFRSSDLITNNFIRFKNSIDSSSRVYVKKNVLTGLSLTQEVAGHEGNTKTIFHHYEENKKGNIVLSNFTGGSSTTPNIGDAVARMHPGSTDLRPYDHKSSTAGMIYGNNECGTDSIAFGGLVKQKFVKVKST